MYSPGVVVDGLLLDSDFMNVSVLGDGNSLLATVLNVA